MANLNLIKQFWIKKIKELINDYQPTEGYLYYDQIKDTWEDNLKNQKDDISDITDEATEICRTILNSKAFFGGYSSWDFNRILVRLNSSAVEYVALIDKAVEEYQKELVAVKTELKNYKDTWDSHPTDYTTIKQERDDLQIQKNNLTAERDRLKEQLGGKTNYDEIKQDISKQIITDSGLSLDQNSTFEQIIAKIKELIKQPDNTEKEMADLRRQITAKDQTIADLRKPNEQVMNELKEKIKVSWQKIGLNNPELEKSLSEVQTYQQLVDLEQKIMKEEQEKKQSRQQDLQRNNRNLKIGLVSVLIIMAMVVGGLMLAKKKKTIEPTHKRFICKISNI